MEDYEVFKTITGALTKLVVLSIIIERGFAFIFENEWFNLLYYKNAREVSDPNNPDKTIRRSRISGLKGIIVLATSWWICQNFCFDILHILFPIHPVSIPGLVVTAFVVAGGSSGAIAVFQGFLNISKKSRDALVAAKKTEAESAKEIAVLAVLEAKAKKEKAEAEKDEAEARKKIAEAQITGTSKGGGG